MKYLILAATFSLSFTFTSAFAFFQLTGQQALNDGRGTVVCYYTDYGTGNQYSKTVLYTCPSQ